MPHITGYFQDDAWNRIILQLCHNEKAVKHAAVALASVHLETLQQRGRLCCIGSLRPNFSLKHYSKALVEFQALLKRKDTSIDAILACALLCTHTEALWENYFSSLWHANGAISVLQEKPSSYTSSSLVAALLRADMQFSIYISIRPPRMQRLIPSHDLILPDAVHNVEHARSVVNPWIYISWHFIRTVANKYRFHIIGSMPLEAIEESQRIERELIALDKLLGKFERKSRLLSNIQQQTALNLLITRTKTMRMLVTASAYTEESIYDAFTADFADILRICKQIRSIEMENEIISSVLLDEGLMYPLFITACGCRDSRIRRAALQELKGLSVSRKAWYVSLITRLAERCIQLEEQYVSQEIYGCHQLPEWCRIHSAEMKNITSTAVNGAVVVLRRRLNGMDGEWSILEEYISW